MLGFPPGLVLRRGCPSRSSRQLPLCPPRPHQIAASRSVCAHVALLVSRRDHFWPLSGSVSCDLKAIRMRLASDVSAIRDHRATLAGQALQRPKDRVKLEPQKNQVDERRSCGTRTRFRLEFCTRSPSRAQSHTREKKPPPRSFRTRGGGEIAFLARASIRRGGLTCACGALASEAFASCACASSSGAT